MTKNSLNLNDATAPATRETYGRHIAAFAKWLKDKGLPFETVADRDRALSTWIEDGYAQGLSPAYLHQRVCALRWQAKQDDALPVVGRRTETAVKAAARSGYDRGLGQVDPLTWSMVRQVTELAAQERTITGDRDAALLRTGSDALLRIGEIRSLRWTDVSILPTGAGTLTIRRSKTDQVGRGKELYLKSQTVSYLRRWREFAPYREDPDAVVFTKVSRHGHALASGPLSIQGIRDVIQRRAELAGYGDLRISGHSLRVGAALSLARRGASLPQLMELGRWTSPQTVQRYIAGETAAHSLVAQFDNE